MNNVKPNLFYWATSELSQDAFIAWLLQWADPLNKKFDEKKHELGSVFLKNLIQLQLPDYKKEISSVFVRRQYHNIDICAEINDDIFLIIEDKTFTSHHGEQLETYRRWGNDHYSGHNKRQVVCVYLKTGSETKASLEIIKRKGYAVFTRQMFLDTLKAKDTSSEIVKDFYENLMKVEKSESEFEGKKIQFWEEADWIGFYRFLENNDSIERWEYVNNSSGGFMNAIVQYNESMPYLQIEQDELCFKIAEIYENRSNVRNAWHDIIIAEAEKLNYAVEKPSRFGSGVYMTVAVVKKEIWLCDNDGFASLPTALKILENYKEFLHILHGNFESKLEFMNQLSKKLEHRFPDYSICNEISGLGSLENEDSIYISNAGLEKLNLKLVVAFDACNFSDLFLGFRSLNSNLPTELHKMLADLFKDKFEIDNPNAKYPATAWINPRILNDISESVADEILFQISKLIEIANDFLNRQSER